MSTEESHPPHSPCALAVRFMQASEREAHLLYSQLLQCPQCTKALQELMYWSETLGHPSPLVASEFITRHRLFEQLAVSPKPRLESIVMDSIYHQWGLSTLFLEQSQQALKSAPEYALDAALSSLEIAHLLSKDFYSEALVNDLIGRAEMQVLEAQLEVGESSEGVSRLAKVRVHLRQGTGCPQLLAALDYLEGRLLTLLGCKEEALRVYDRGLRFSLEALNQSSKTSFSSPFPRHPFGPHTTTS